MRYRLILKESIDRVNRKMLLTSTGLDNTHFISVVKKLLNKDISQCRVLFIPTADKKKESIKACIKELLDLGINKTNIVWNNCTVSEDTNFDMIYVTGGDENYLIDQITFNKFKPYLLKLINSGIFYLGVSAGTYICGKMVDRPNQSLGLFNYIIEPHQTSNLHPNKPVHPVKGVVNISDNQAILVYNGKVRVIE